MLILDCVVPENIHTPPTEGFLVWTPHPSGNSILVSYFPSKKRVFENPLPLGISINLPWGGPGYFMELHITINWTAYVLQLTATNSSCPWSFPLTVGTWPIEGYRKLQWLELIKPWLCSKLDESYANDLAVGNVDTKSGKKINSYPNFWKVCGFSYSSITSSQSYKCLTEIIALLINGEGLQELYKRVFC